MQFFCLGFLLTLGQDQISLKKFKLFVKEKYFQTV